MCTITLVAGANSAQSFILTSNRDEASERKALAPDFEVKNGVELLFPKDPVGGGSWIGVSSQKRVACLMNGAFKPHKRNLPYRKSRGQVLKEILLAKNASEILNKISLEGIEAFTIIIADWNENLIFYELVWDEEKKHVKKLDETPKIWSSSPLYSEEMKKMRETWFTEIKNDLSAENILEFHHSGGIGDKELDLIIDRGFLKTQSISQLILEQDMLNFWYKDLKTGKITQQKMLFN